MTTERLVVLTAAWPSSRYPATGGFIRNLAEALRARIGDVAVVKPAFGAGDRDGAYGFPNPLGRPKLRRPSFVLGILYLAGAFRTLLKICSRFRPSSLLVHWALPLGPAGLLAARKLKVPLFVWVHGSDLEVYGAGSRVMKETARWVLRRSSSVFAVSESLAAQARLLGAERVLKLPMGVNRAFKEMKKERAPEGPFTALFLGDFIVSKGIRAVLQGARLLGSARRIRFDFVGGGPLAREIERAGGRVLGYAPPCEVVKFLDRSHVLLLPSRSEGTPLSVLEALCRGVPPVASRVGGIPEWVRYGGEGLLLSRRPGPAELARCLGRLYDDELLLRRLREGARKRGEEVLTSEEVADRFLEETAKAAAGERAWT